MDTIRSFTLILLSVLALLLLSCAEGGDSEGNDEAADGEACPDAATYPVDKSACWMLFQDGTTLESMLCNSSSACRSFSDCMVNWFNEHEFTNWQDPLDACYDPNEHPFPLCNAELVYSAHACGYSCNCKHAPPDPEDQAEEGSYATFENPFSEESGGGSG